MIYVYVFNIYKHVVNYCIYYKNDSSNRHYISCYECKNIKYLLLLSDFTKALRNHRRKVFFLKSSKEMQRSECKHIAANISLELEQGKLPQGRFRTQEQPQILVH